MIARLLAVALSVSAFPSWAASLGDSSEQSFNPTAGESFAIAIAGPEPGDYIVDLYTPDGDLVRSLSLKVASDKDEGAKVVWDGLDAEGTPVPDEAYVPVLRQGDQVLDDPREYSGGEVVDSIRPDFSRLGVVAFQLDEPSRVLVRAGIKGGPLMRTLLNWAPRPAGSNIVRWDGYDKDGIVKLRDRSDLGILLTGYRLPEHSIITTGSSLSYLDWRKARELPDTMPSPESVQLERNGERVSRHYYLPRLAEKEPDVSLDIRGHDNVDGSFVADGPFTVTADLDGIDQWAMDQSQYEVAFFINGEFVSEEEQGYVPLSWRWNPASLAPGTHLLTVNVSSFNGAVGVRTLEFIVDEQEN